MRVVAIRRERSWMIDEIDGDLVLLPGDVLFLGVPRPASPACTSWRLRRPGSAGGGRGRLTDLDRASTCSWR